MAHQLTATIGVLRDRDLFFHDGSKLRRIRLSAQFQAFLFLVMLALVGWSAYSTARKHIFIMPAARRISQPAPEPSELSRVVQVSLDDFRTVLADGALTDLDAGLLCLQRLT